MRAAFAFAVGGVALQALQVAQDAIEVRAHLLNLIVERAALLRLAAEQREEAAAFAAQAAALRGEPVELGLLALRGVLVALDLFGALRIDMAPRSTDRELALESHADRIALREAGGWQRRVVRPQPVAQAATASAAGMTRRNSVRITVSFMEQSRTRRIDDGEHEEAPEWCPKCERILRLSGCGNQLCRAPARGYQQPPDGGFRCASSTGSR